MMPSPDQYDDILRHGSHYRLTPGDTLFCEGDAANLCYLVTDGCLKLSKLNAQGREVILRYISAGEMMAALAVLKADMYPVTAQAIKPTEVIAWNREGFINLTRSNPEVALNLLMSVFDRLEDLQKRYLERNSEQTEQRIARFIVSMMKHAGQHGGNGMHIDIPLTRQNIADYIGASMYTVSRILSTWEKAGWMKSSRKHITIMEPNNLPYRTTTNPTFPNTPLSRSHA